MFLRISRWIEEDEVEDENGKQQSMIKFIILNLSGKFIENLMHGFEREKEVKNPLFKSESDSFCSLPNNSLSYFKVPEAILDLLQSDLNDSFFIW